MMFAVLERREDHALRRARLLAMRDDPAGHDPVARAQALCHLDTALWLLEPILGWAA